MHLVSLLGRRILVVENDPILGLGYEDILIGAGAEVIGPVASVAEAEDIVNENDISAALLDIRLDDGEVWPVARLLARKSVPFAFCTGFFDPNGLQATWPGRPVLGKPTNPQRLINTLANMLAS
jgi:DNA-binding response OmpR family regulator